MILPLHRIDSWSSSLTTSSIPTNCYLSDVAVFDVEADGHFAHNRFGEVLPVVHRALASGTAEVTTSQLPLDAASAIAIPVYRDNRIVSIVVLLSRKSDETIQDPIGVFEVWEPIGPYEEVALKDGYYGAMERFHNVSSFVRFEKGNGLPGQVWDRRCAVIHDDLANHTGFLRAAGASADLLRTAIGIPIAGDRFHAAAVLISSVSTPIARGMEVWSVLPDSNDFELTSSAYYQLGDDYALPIGTVCHCDAAPFVRMRTEKRAMVTDDPNELLAGRDPRLALPGPTSGLVIPFFDGVTLTSLAVLLF
ncbi:hypothetical protein Pla100_06520 [Neorhodopirellula pilleata]|uniref:GAF domain-containing protein n=1 Tax=Neorhodopirellula pilleata TaxID=2714738 RepID=A0A5C6AXE9_9BACT|nr:hypothetical protein Pla100_06520 [Neorhodopirellula pilleata]